MIALLVITAIVFVVGGLYLSYSREGRRTNRSRHGWH